jgi:hypothetical protein
MGLKSLDPKSLIATNRSKAQVVKANILRIIGSVVKQMMGFNDKGVDP